MVIVAWFPGLDLLTCAGSPTDGHREVHAAGVSTLVLWPREQYDQHSVSHEKQASAALVLRQGTACGALDSVFNATLVVP